MVAAAPGRRCNAVLFDLDDTLVPTSQIDAEAIAGASALGAKRLGLGPQEAAGMAAAFVVLLGAKPFPPAGSAESIAVWRTRLWARALAPRGGGEPFAGEVHDSWSSARLAKFVLAPDVRAMVQRLQADGYRTGVVTNGHAEVQRAKAGACDLRGLFGERVVVSGEQPECKPARSIFETSLALIGARADETVMVGDRLDTDIQGGINAELLATVWVRGDAPDPHEGAPRPTVTVGSVLELERYLERLQ
ncbi:HAD-like domain-containing protein [Pavlovales sp. CCMP2436]|nr:HAD-like domain-containing protein [Pavlovales sp. CCMP2436]